MAVSGKESACARKHESVPFEVVRLERCKIESLLVGGDTSRTALEQSRLLVRANRGFVSRSLASCHFRGVVRVGIGGEGFQAKVSHSEVWRENGFFGTRRE